MIALWDTSTMQMADDIRERFIRRGSAIGVIACGVLTVVDLVRGDPDGLLWNGWYFGSLMLAYLLFRVTRSRLLWAIFAAQAPVVHLAFASGDSAILAYFWAFPFPVLVFFVLGLRRGAAVAGTLWVAASCIIIVRSESIGLGDMAPDVIASLGVVTLLGLAYEYLRDRYETVLRLSLVTDELTGVFNRRRFNSALDDELKRAARYERPFSLILFDLDDFKGINDEYGHPTGDEILVELAKVVTEQLRETDLLSRLGGDEFAIIAPETPTRGEGTFEAVNLAERIRERVEAHSFSAGLSLTLSLGVTERVPGDDSSSIVQRADDALYLAKARGRNCVATKGTVGLSESKADDSSGYLDRRAGLAHAE